MTIGERIRDRRQYMRMTQKELADAIGATYQLISNYENGVVKDVPGSKVALLADALNCDPLWLAYGVAAQDELSADQLELVSLIEKATPEQVRNILSYAKYVVMKR